MNALRDLSTILSLPANVSESEALRAFRSNNASSLYWRFFNGPLLRLAQAFIPFGLHCVTYELGRTHHERFLALDQVEGGLDLFEFPGAVDLSALVSTRTRNYMFPAVSNLRTEAVLREKVLRMIFQQGFFRLRHPNLAIKQNIAQFYIPYWLGFYGQEQNMRCRALDALRSRMEGEKVTVLFERWLAT